MLTHWKVTFFIFFLFSSPAVAQITILLGVIPSVGNTGESLSVVIKGIGIPQGINTSQINLGADISVQSVERLPSQTVDSNGNQIVVDAIRTTIAIAATASQGARYIRVATSAFSFPAVFTVVSGTGTEPPPTGSDTRFALSNYAARGENPEGVVAIDLTRDGRDDLAVATDGDYHTLLFRANSDGKLGAVKKLREPEFGAAIITTADFNNDSNPDLAIGNRSATEVIIRIGTGGLNFAKSLRTPLRNPAWALGAGDFNGDSRQDLVAVTRDTNGIELLLGNGDGTFQQARALSAGDTPRSIAVADLNRDGLDDAVVGNFTSMLSVYMGNRTQGLSPQKRKRTPTTIDNLTAADLSGDGNPDIVTIGDNSIVIFRGSGTGALLAPKRIRIVDFLFDVAAADFDGDSRIDLAFSNFAAGQLSIITNLGNLNFSPPVNLNTGSDPKRIVTGDFNGDGRADLAVTNYLSHSLSIYLNQTQ